MLRLAAFMAMAVVWGLTWLAAKSATAAAPPVFVAALRLILAAVLFAGWCLVARLPFAVRRPRRLLASALLINTGCYSFLFWGVAHAPTGLAAILNLSLIPFLSITIGAAYREEVITPRRVAAMALGILGLVLLFSTRSHGGGEGGRVAEGLGAVVIGTFSYAWGAIVSKPLVRATSPIVLAFWQTLIGGVAMLLVSVALEGFSPSELGHLAQGRALAGFSFLVLGGSLVGFSVYLWLLREWGAFRAGLYAFVSPVIAVAIGVLYAGEPFGAAEAAGMATMLAAAGLAIRRGEATVSSATGSSHGRPA